MSKSSSDAKKKKFLTSTNRPSCIETVYRTKSLWFMDRNIERWMELYRAKNVGQKKLLI